MPLWLILGRMVPDLMLGNAGLGLVLCDDVVEGLGAARLLENHDGDHIFIEEGRLAIGDLMAESHSGMLLQSLRDGAECRLHPFQIAGKVDMAREVDLRVIDVDGKLIRRNVSKHRFRVSAPVSETSGCHQPRRSPYDSSKD